MDQKNRLIIAIAVTLLIVAAMFTSFGRSLFSMRTEHISSLSPAPPPAARRGEAPLSPPSCSSGWR